MLSELIQGIISQSSLSISQAISIIESDREEGSQLLTNLYEHTGNAYRLGITGPPGAGKSLLTNNLISAYRKKGNKVAVIAVDPTSPFSGGAVLGDRIRMSSHYADPNVFVRSMATRGGQGGLALKTQEVGEIMDAAGFNVIIYETVGVGQIELDVIQATDTVVVVLVPESGDEIQMLKAGLMEIGNIFAINKADRPGANKLMTTLNNLLLSLSKDAGNWSPQVFHTVATEGKGINSLVDAINSHRIFNEEQGVQQQKMDEQYKRRITGLITDDYVEKIWNEANCYELQKELKKNHHDRTSPYDFAKQMQEK